MKRNPLLIVLALFTIAGISVAMTACQTRADDQPYAQRSTWREVREDQRYGISGSCAVLGTGCEPRVYRDERRAAVPRSEGVTTRLNSTKFTSSSWTRVYGWRSYEYQPSISCTDPRQLPPGLMCRGRP